MSTLSWGLFPSATQAVHPIYWRHEALPSLETSVLPRGLGRSYGDSCLNDGGTLLLATGLDKLIAFDQERGILECETGVSLDQILAFSVPRGWFLPVTPGTRFVTLGGAIANDVHGKNHHRMGCFGAHVLSLELLRSDGQRLICSPREHADLFGATIAGMGLTGLMTRATIQLLKIDNPFMDVEQIRFGGLDELETLIRESDTDYDYTVSWVDTAATGRALGRGIFMRGNHAAAIHNHRKRKWPREKTLPLMLPEWVLNPLTMKGFNTLFYRRQLRGRSRAIVDYVPYFYPLDAVNHWNRAYGKRGFLQHQCLVSEMATIAEILTLVAKHRQCSFLTVLKAFGDVPSPGMMSFPRKGLTLTMDFPASEAVLKMCDAIDRVVADVGGSIYPAKDARMSAEHFKRFFPRWRAFAEFIDPAFSSSAWRRLTKGAQP